MFLSQDWGTSYSLFKAPPAPLRPPEVVRHQSPLHLSDSIPPYEYFVWDEDGELHGLFPTGALLWSSQQVERANGEKAYMCRDFVYYAHSQGGDLQSFAAPVRLYADQVAPNKVPIGLALASDRRAVAGWREGDKESVAIYLSVLE